MDTDAQLHILKVVADDGDAKGDLDDVADLGGRSERVDESHSSCTPHDITLLASALHRSTCASNVVADRQAAHASAAHCADTSGGEGCAATTRVVSRVSAA